jgi:hypothetical protein
MAHRLRPIEAVAAMMVRVQFFPSLLELSSVVPS